MLIINSSQSLRSALITLIIYSACVNTVYSAEEAINSDSEETQASETQANETPNAVTIEEITVTAQRSFFLLRSQLEAAEVRLYSAYNDFNEDNDYDVNCRKTSWTATRIQEQQCWPAFFDELVAENSQDAFIGLGFVVPVQQLASQYSDRFDELRTNILKVASENPEVAEALLEMGKLERALEQKREECMKQEPVLFLFRYCP